jgi:protein ImuB
MSLADARALMPGIAVEPWDPRADAAALMRLAGWAGRYTPFVALDGPDGLMLDISGAAHLFGTPGRHVFGSAQTRADEALLLADLIDRISARGIAVRGAIGPTAASAAALARFGPARAIIGHDPTEIAQAIRPLGLGALRLDGAIINAWRRLGLTTIGEVADMPRASIARRYGALAITRLDEALGRGGGPITPMRPAPHYHARMVFAEPVADLPSIMAACERLAQSLGDLLAVDKRGARRVELSLFRVDGAVSRIVVGTARPTRAPDHLARLFADRLDGIGGDLDVGFGFDALSLAAVVSEDLVDLQSELDGPVHNRRAPVHGIDNLGALVDRLGNRLGLSRVGRLVPQASHLPEAAVVFESLAQAGMPETPVSHDWRADERARLPRPLRLLGAPEPVEVMAEVPDGPPARFRWRRVDYQIAAAEGPERIAPEWWQGEVGAGPKPTRDYFRVEDNQGRRFWLYRDGLYSESRNPRWYLHGVFA